MCLEPTILEDGTPVRCRYCWQCQKDRVNDLVGRSIAESHYSAASYSVTLTYRESEANGARVSTLVYQDVQLFLKRLRKRGYRVRYICAGEYGSIKGRAHWHIVLFFKDKGPNLAHSEASRGPWEILLERRILWAPWPHGFVYFQQPDYGGFRYALKYALKDTEQAQHVGHLAMSKKPPLGFEFVQDLARQYVEAQLAPQNLRYAFGSEFDANGKRRSFRLWGRSAEIFCETFQEEWAAAYPDRRRPESEMLDSFEDAQARAAAWQWEETPAQLHARRGQWPMYINPGSSAFCVTDDDYASSGPENWWPCQGRLPTEPEFDCPDWLYILSQDSDEPLNMLVCEPEYGHIDLIQVETPEGPRLWIIPGIRRNDRMTEEVLCRNVENMRAINEWLQTCKPLPYVPSF